jgi:hypothetical protein
MTSPSRSSAVVAAVLLYSCCEFTGAHDLADYVKRLQGTNSRFEFTHEIQDSPFYARVQLVLCGFQAVDW